MIRSLPVELTDEELRAKANELASVVSGLGSYEREKSEVSKQIGGKIEQARKEMGRLSQQISTKQEWRDVACEEQFDFEENIVRVIRKDTGDTVDTRVMRPEERQQRMKLVPIKKEAEDALER
jgi:hypothetical protein